jgi:ABC-type transport system involved in cytochrome c biogenesis permease subunit
VHVTTITLSSGLLFVPGIASLLYLLRRSPRGALVERMPRRRPGRLARTTIVAFPLYVRRDRRAIWAEAAGPVLGLDEGDRRVRRRVVYAAYLHARATAGW